MPRSNEPSLSSGLEAGQGHQAPRREHVAERRRRSLDGLVHYQHSGVEKWARRIVVLGVDQYFRGGVLHAVAHNGAPRDFAVGVEHAVRGGDDVCGPSYWGAGADPAAANVDDDVTDIAGQHVRTGECEGRPSLRQRPRETSGAVATVVMVELGGANAVAEDHSGTAVELTAKAAASTARTGRALTRPSADVVGVLLVPIRTSQCRSRVERC